MGYGLYSYEIKSADGQITNALDAPAVVDTVFDVSTMSAVGLLATSNRDLEGDVFVASGCDFSWHKRNPIVLLDHGKSGYALPIGKTEDQNGNYTVRVDTNGDVWQTTYFSQHSYMAEQLFHLITEKILRANSIRFRILEQKPLQVDRAKGLPPGCIITRSEMQEASWCALPVNPDAVMRCYSAGKIGGKSMAPEIKSMLEPYILKTKSWVNVPTLNIKDTTMMKAEPEGTREEPADQPNEQTVPVEDKAEETQAEPLGKTVLASMSEGLKGLAEGIAKQIGPCEHEKVKGQIGKHLEALKAMCAKIDELHEKEYGSGEDTEEASEEEGTESEAESEAESEDEGKSEDEGEGTEAKSLLASMLRDRNLSRTHRTALGIVSKALNRKQVKEPEKVEETLTPAEEKELAQLERAVQRRLDLIAKL